MADQLKAELNEQLKYPTYYESVFVLVVNWKESDCPGFKEESDKVGELFASSFSYTVEKYTIPSEGSQLTLDSKINEVIKHHGARSLLIVHYGGHGDSDDSEKDNRMSVWAAQRQNGPTLNWSEIQSKFRHSKSDVLLLLDCCFAAQAGRDRVVPGRVELLAACGMGLKTTLPGPGSFTSALIRELENVLKTSRKVTVRDLHARLARKNARLFQTPVYMELQEGSRSTIHLRPLDDAPSSERVACRLRFHVSMHENITQSSLPEIIRWLKNEAPPTVSALAVENIILTTEHVDDFIYGQRAHETPSGIFNELPDSAQREVVAAWERFNGEVTNSKSVLNSSMAILPSGAAYETNTHNHAQKFVNFLTNRLSILVGSIGESIVALAEPNEGNILWKAVRDKSLEGLGLKDLLKLRTITAFPSESGSLQQMNSATSLASNENPKTLLSNLQHPNHGSVLAEYKVYADTDAQGSARILTVERIRQLVNLLKASKPAEFLSLTCLECFHEPLKNRFGLVFRIPEEHDSSPVTLHELIGGGKGSRPTLGQRFHLAAKVGRAVQKWHSVGWVHQNVSSHNVVFFRKNESREINYLNPYLCGFEFARPSGGVSSPRTIDDFDFNVYRHPERQGSAIEQHQKIHDIYSYGVLLYEIGRWQHVTNNFTSAQREKVSSSEISEKVQRAAKSSLPHHSGARFARAALACLSEYGLKPEMDDKTESRLAVAFKERVLNELTAGFELD